MTIDEYKAATNRAISNLSKFFKPGEKLVLYDFVKTVTQEDIDEPKKESKV